MGLLLYRRGKFAEAAEYFRRAIQRLTLRNPNPYDGEPFYNLGLALKMQGRYQEAYDAFYKAVWNAAWRSPAYFELARLAGRFGRWEEVIDLSEDALVTNIHHHQARHLQAMALRRLGRTQEALAIVTRSLALDGLDFGAWYEKYLLTGDSSYRVLMRDNAHSYIQIALDYAHAGCFAEAIALLEEAPSSDPMVKYFQGWVHLQAGDETSARECFVRARHLPPDYCFPNQLEAVLALEAALTHCPDDPRAPYYLGNFWYAHRRYEEAIAAWERAQRLDPSFPTVHRNLGLSYMNKRHDPARALQCYEQAFRLDPTDARVFFELDQLRKRMGDDPAERLVTLERYADLVSQRDDLTIEQVMLLNALGRPEEALAILLHRTFHPWEGGEGKVTGQYVLSLVELAKRCLAEQKFDEAIALLERARVYPPNLGEGKLQGTLENHIFYYLGCAYEALGQPDRAQTCFQQASEGLLEPASPMYYNDQPPDMIFYQGLALRKIGRPSEAQDIFNRLIDYGRTHLDEAVTMDYFAVSLPDFLVFDVDLNRRNRLHCHYMMALGYLGLGAYERALEHFQAVLREEPHHLGARIHLAMVRKEQGFSQ